MDWQSATAKAENAVLIPDRWLHLHYYEALNILFRMENALRVFTYVVLKNNFEGDWSKTSLQTAEDEQSNIAATATKRMAQAQSFGYLGYEISSPLMYLNSGELVRLVTSDTYWEIFKPYFKAKREIIKTKLDEIGTVRNALAHFRPIKSDDIELIKQNVKHAFLGIEQCLNEMTQTHQVVPTNTTSEWYQKLMTLGSASCKIALYQSGSENWIRVDLEYRSAILREHGGGEYRSFQLTKLNTPAVVKSFPSVTNICTFVAENISYPIVTPDNSPDFSKHLSLVFSKKALVKHYLSIEKELRAVLLEIENETELVQNDNLARGQFIDSVPIFSSLRRSEGGSGWWSTNTQQLRSVYGEDDPTEFWGEVNNFSGDYIAAADKFPWMPSDISKEDLPF